MPTGVYKRTAAHLKILQRNAQNARRFKKKRKYAMKSRVLVAHGDAMVSVPTAIAMLRKAKKEMTMDDLGPKDLYVLLALQELQGDI